jgi:hypothetical protein
MRAAPSLSSIARRLAANVAKLISRASEKRALNRDAWQKSPG